MNNNPRIVVGVDGSPLSINALAFAIEEARLRHGHLHVTYAYPVMEKPVTGSTGKDYYEQVEAEAREFMEGIMSGAPSTDGLEVEWLAVPGNPAEVLIEASRGARRPLNARIFDRGERVERTRGWSHCWMNRTVGEWIIASVDSV